MDRLAQDLRDAWRAIWRTPLSTLVALLTLALGVGGTTLIFTIVHGVLLRPLPYGEPERLVQLWQYDPARPFERGRVTPANLADWRAQQRVFEELAYIPAWSGSRTWTLIGRENHERVAATFVSANIFRTLGVAPTLGRVFRDDEDLPGQAPTVVISHAFWQRHFGGDAQVIGRTVTLDSHWRRTYEVVGVMPAGFDLPGGTGVADNDAGGTEGAGADALWMPMGYSEIGIHGPAAPGRCCPWFVAIARLKPETTVTEAQAAIDVIAARIAAAHPDADFGRGVKVVPLREELVGGARPALLLLFGAVACVLLIACLNVANLLLARAAARQRELAIRTALGARRADIVRQMLAESVIVSLGGGLIGTALALAGVRATAGLLGAYVPRAEAVQVDAAVLAFSLLISIGTGIAFGLAPAWQAATVRPQDAMTDTSRSSTAGRRHQRLRAWLVVIEIAGALILIGSATLLARSLLRLQSVDPGFRADHLLVVDLDMTSTVFGRGEGRTPTDVFFSELMTRVSRMPGVHALAGTNTAPMTGAAAIGGDPGTALTVEGEPLRSEGESPRAQRTAVTPGYFDTLGVPLRRGRAFTDDDRTDRPPVAIVNETMAARLWPGQDPIGRRFLTLTREGVARMRGRGEPDARIFRWTEVVGVIADLRTQALREPPRPQMYVPWRQYPWHTAQLVIRTSGAPLALAGAVRAESRRLNTAAIVTRVSSMDRIVSGTAAQPRLGAFVLGLFAGAGLLLAAIGLYGVMAHTVTHRTAEVGIRMALGATRAAILRLVLRQGLLLTAGGVTLGLLGARLTTRLLQPMLYDTSPADPLSLTGTILLLTTVALAAAAIPAWRAARVDPLVALRSAALE